MHTQPAVTAMLLRKEWGESRMRFVLCAAVVGGLCALFILLQEPLRAQMHGTTMPDTSYAGYVYRRIYGGFVRGLFLFQAMILGLGGLQRERARGTLGFTLALPATRLQLIGARALTGVLEIAVLACIPAVLVPALSALVGESYALSQATEFALLWVIIGMAVFSVALLASAAIRSEYAALTTVLLAFYIYPLVVVKTPILQDRPLHIHYIMNGTGMRYFNPQTDLLTGPIPVLIIGGYAVATLALLLLAAWATEREDFA